MAAVCKIEIVDANDGHVLQQGTGFHYGSGWVMSNAHVFQTDDDEPNRHSYLPLARFTFGVDGNPLVFEPRQRTAIVHRLQPGPMGNTRDIDIALVKLGAQYEYGRGSENDWDPWERQEKNYLRHIPITADMAVPALESGNSAQAIYPHPDTGLITVADCVIGCVRGNVIELRRPEDHNAAWPLPPGSSDCIVSVAETPGSGNFLLAAIHFMGGEHYSYALSVKHGAGERFLNVGNQIIAHIGPYITCSNVGLHDDANEERNDLVELAQQHHLTIYIPVTGEIIDGQ